MPIMQDVYKIHEPDITVKLSYRKEIRVTDFIDLLSGISSEFDHYIENDSKYLLLDKKDRPKLYITEIKQGSIVAQLVAIYPDIVENIDSLNTMLEFGLIMHELFDRRKQEKLDEKDRKNQEKILAPLLQDEDASLRINIKNYPKIIKVESFLAEELYKKSQEILKKNRSKRLEKNKKNSDQALLETKTIYDHESMPLIEMDTKIVHTWLGIISPSFEKDGLWKLSMNGKTFIATMRDDNFQAHVNNGEIRFGQKDMLHVKLEISQKLVGSNLKSTFTVLEVIEHKEI